MKASIFNNYILIFCINGVVYSQQKKQAVDTVDAHELYSKARKSDKVYIKDKSLDKYTGTWVWKSGDKSLIITLNKTMHHFGKNGHILDMEMISGQYQYLENGKLIASASGQDIGGSSGGKKDTVDIFVDIKSRKSHVALLLIYLNNNSLELKLNNTMFEYKNDKNFELPLPLVLTKQ